MKKISLILFILLSLSLLTACQEKDDGMKKAADEIEKTAEVTEVAKPKKRPSLPKIPSAEKTTEKTPSVLPDWAIKLGLTDPEGMELMESKTEITTEKDIYDAYNSINLSYRANDLSSVLAEAEKIALKANINLAEKNDISAQYGSREERYGEDEKYSAVILAQLDFDYGPTLTIFVQDEVGRDNFTVRKYRDDVRVKNLGKSGTGTVDRVPFAIDRYYSGNDEYFGSPSHLECLNMESEIYKTLSEGIPRGIARPPMIKNTYAKTKLAGMECTDGYLYGRLSDTYFVASVAETRYHANFDAKKLASLTPETTAEDIAKLIIPNTGKDVLMEVENEDLIYLAVQDSHVKKETVSSVFRISQPTAKDPKKVDERITNCRNDKDCFEKNLNTCTPAGMYLSSSENLNSKASVAPFEKDETCLLYITESGWNTEPTEMICKIPYDKLSEAQKVFNDDQEFIESYCSGSASDYALEKGATEPIAQESDQTKEEARPTNLESFQKANDSQRKSELGALLSAVYQYQTSPTAKGALPECLLGAVPAATPIPECDPDGSGVGVGNGGFEGAVQFGMPANADTYDCSTTLVPSYLREMPIDPVDIYNASATGYWVCQNTTGIVSRIYTIAAGSEMFTNDGGCEIPGTTEPTMCVSG